MMRRLALFLSFILILTGHAMAKKSDLDGNWTAFAAERDGASADELIGNRIEFAGDRFTIAKAGKVVFAGHVALAGSGTPAAIDFTIETGAAKGQAWKGIFKIDKAALTICDNAPDTKADRPKDFAAPKGSGYVCLKFRR
jgi:uncharacterized protein (TIGR03067 family)